MNRLMLDFETLDVAECPVILSMGVVVFNEDGIVDSFFEKIDQHSCLDLGCTVSVDTLLWWEEQSDTAKKSAFGGTTNIGYAMGMLVDLYKKYECEEIWSKGAIADIRWANNILDKLDMKKPWKFSREMCFRTYLKYSHKVDFQPSGEAHNALDDAINQARHWIEINKPMPFQHNFPSLLQAAANFKNKDISSYIQFYQGTKNEDVELNIYFTHHKIMDDGTDNYSYLRLSTSNHESRNLLIHDAIEAFKLFNNEYDFNPKDWDETMDSNPFEDLPF
ncbi:3'-5' exonuclease [Acinetobacter sp. LF10]|uniref:3'-5' exonuclease n=1 Tax=Acinetobacter sp. LF10 TaxID=3403576 RepID=UPI003B228B28